MLSEYPVIGFVPITDAVRARRFYVETLKLKFESDDHFAVVVRGNGMMIRLVRMKEFAPAPYTILGWEVPDIEKAVEELVAADIHFIQYPPLPQSPAGIWTTPSGSKVAWFQDPDGNILSLSQHETGQ